MATKAHLVGGKLLLLDGKASIGEECCCGSCEIATDDFNRADNDDPGASWEEIGGDWDILDNYLHCVSEGVLITTHRQSSLNRLGGGFNIWMTVSLRNFPASGTKSWGIITGYTDANNFNWIELNYNATTTELWPKFYTRSSGTDTLLMDQSTHPAGEVLANVYPEQASLDIEICYAEVEWSVRVSSSEISWEMCGLGQDELPATYGMVGFLKGDFDDWIYKVHWESRLGCPTCTCFCKVTDIDYSCIPETLHLTTTPTTGTVCTEVDSLELTLYQAYPDGSGILEDHPRKYLWFSDTFMIESEELWFVLRCDFLLGGFILNLLGWPSTDPTGVGGNYLFFFDRQYQLIDDDASSCNPISLVFRGLQTFTTDCDLYDPPRTGCRPASCTSFTCVECAELTLPQWDVTITA